MTPFYILFKLEVGRFLKNPKLILMQTFFVGLTFLLYGFSGHSFDDKSFEPFLLLVMLIVAHFHARDFITRFVDTGRMHDIFISPTTLEVTLPLFILLETSFVLLSFYINFSILLLLDVLHPPLLTPFLESATFALLGMLSLSYLVAALLKLSHASAYLGLIIAAPLQVPLFVFFLASYSLREASDLFLLGGVAFLSFALCLLMLPKILQRCF